jgi:predicted secreted protein
LILSKVSSSLNGNEYRAVLTNTLGQFTTASATLTVNFTPVVNTQPVSQAVVVGSQVTFTAAASGNPVATVQWQVSTNNGKTFTNLQDSTDVQGSATGTLTLLAVPQSASGYQYRALFSNTLNPTAPVASKAAVLTVGVVPNAATPANVTVNAGQTATFAVTLSGSPTPTVQWQVSSNGGSTWSNVTSGGTSASLILSKVSSTLNGNEYRAVLTNAVGQFTTASATLTVNFAPVVSTQPVSQTLPVGSQVTFTAAASGNPAASVQWQVSTNKGKTFTNLQDGTGVQGSATGTLTLLAVPQSASGYQYRALFSNTLNPTAPVASKAAVLTVDVPPSAATPANVTVNAGQTATFAVTLSGSPTPTVQWQVSSNDGTTWSNVTSGGTSASLILSKVSSSLNGNEYRAVLTNAIGQFTTAPATLTVNGAPVVSTQPVSQTVAVGSQATFTAAASGNPAASVQWQVSTNNGKTFTNLQDGTNVQGSATGTLTLLAVPQSASGYQYRALFNNGIGTAATTSAASLTVLVPPGVQANPSSQTAVNGTATFSVVPTGTTPTVQWQVSTNGTTWQNVTGATTATLKLTGLAAAQNQSRYRAVVRNGLGTFTTDAATLTVLFGPVISA